jgi:hypothetical protein
MASNLFKFSLLYIWSTLLCHSSKYLPRLVVLSKFIRSVVIVPTNQFSFGFTYPSPLVKVNICSAKACSLPSEFTTSNNSRRSVLDKPGTSWPALLYK